MIIYCFIVAFFILALFIMLSTRNRSICKTLEDSVSTREYKHTDIQVCFFIISLIVLWFLTAFRSSEIGNDTITYVRYFSNVISSGNAYNKNFEYGFQLLTLLISKFTSNPYIFLVVISSICYVGVGIYVYKYSDNPVFSAILIYGQIFSFFMTGLRQAIAMVIVLYAYQYIKDGKLFRALLLIILASSFHATAWVVILLFFNKILPKRTRFVLSIAVGLSAVSFAGLLDNVIVGIIGQYASYYSSDLINDSWLGVLYYCLRNSVFFMIVSLSYKNRMNENALVVSNFVLLLLFVCLGFSLNIFTRVSYYFLLISVVELPNAINRGILKNKKMYIFLICLFTLAYFLITLILRPEWYSLYPYRFYWN